MTPKYLSLVLLVALAGIAACHSDPKDPVVAKIGERVITRSEIDAYLKLKHIDNEDSPRRARALEDYLEREELADAIEQEKALDPQLLKAELREYQKEQLISRYFDKVLADKGGDQAIANYYSANADKYQEKKVHVAHILFRTNAKMSEEERKAKLTAAQDAYSKLQAGADFAKLAAEVSDDKVSAGSGGDLGWLRDGSVDPRFSRQAFALGKDGLSQPFESSFGYHIVKVIEPVQDVKRPLDSVRGDIRYQLRAEAKQAEMARLQGKLKVERVGSGTKEKPGTATAQRD